MTFIHKLTEYTNSHGTFTRPSTDSIYMQLALSFAERSTCCRLKVGAVFVTPDHQRVLCVGYNGNHALGPNECDSHEPGACGCLHAEINAIAKNMGDLRGSHCFVTHMPCIQCAKIMINCHVKRVIYYNDYRKSDGIDLLKRVNVTVEKFEASNTDQAYLDITCLRKS